MDSITFINPKTGASVPIPGEWIAPTLFLPSVLKEEFEGNSSWKPFSLLFTKLFPDAPLMISSVKSDMFGKPRAKGSSHIKGYSLDIAPIYSKTSALHPDARSPRLADQRGLAVFIAQISASFPCGIVLEGDHFHIDGRYPSGCFLYSTYRYEYAHDAENKELAASPIHKVIFEAFINGEISHLRPELTKLINSFK